MKILLLSLLSLSTSRADTATPPEAYKCEVILVAASLPGGSAKWNFSLSDEARQHGGDPLELREGEYEVSVMADPRWLGISWSKAGNKIAEGVFVLGSSDRAQNRVAILYDPSGSGDQVSLGCDQPN